MPLLRNYLTFLFENFDLHTIICCILEVNDIIIDAVTCHRIETFKCKGGWMLAQIKEFLFQIQRCVIVRVLIVIIIYFTFSYCRVTVCDGLCSLFMLIAVCVPFSQPARLETREVTGISLYAGRYVEVGFRELLD